MPAVNLTLLVPDSELSEYIERIERFAHPDLHLLNDPSEHTDVVFGTSSKIFANLKLMPNLKWAQSTWAGVEIFNQMNKPQFVLTNARGIFGHLMAEYVFGYLLFIEKDIQTKLNNQKQKIWDSKTTGNIRGKTIAILGVGSIGSEIARTAKFFGLKTKGFTQSSESSPDIDQYFHSLPLNSFFEDVDYVVNVLPNTSSTQNILDVDSFKLMPKNAIVINAGRGVTVDEGALTKALNEGWIKAAILDVFKDEPLPMSSPLWDARNCFITSHTSAHTYIDDIFPIFTRNFEAFIEGYPMVNVVDMDKGY